VARARLRRARARLTRWRGLLALVGFALSLLLVTPFIVPGLLAGHSALAVSVIGSLAVSS
jgi:uncharacterized membrane protein